MEVITFANIKGGVGKTTLSYNYGAYLASKGKKVLMLDLDQQSSLSRTYGVTSQAHTVEEIFNIYDDNREEVAIHHVDENVDLISGTTRLDKIQSRLETYNNKNMLLFQWLQNHFDDVVDKYDYMIIDCHPDLNLATKNAICVSDVVLSPVIPNKYAYDAITELEIRMDELRKETIDFRTGETYVKAKTYYIANAIKMNTGIAHDFLDSIKDENQENGKWIAEIPHFELFNRSTYYSVPICKMEELANTPSSKLSEDEKNDSEFMTEYRYFNSQKKGNYQKIDKIFDTITKYV